MLKAIFNEFNSNKALIGQFNKGERCRYQREMDANISKLFVKYFADYYQKYFPQDFAQILKRCARQDRVATRNGNIVPNSLSPVSVPNERSDPPSGSMTDDRIARTEGSTIVPAEAIFDLPSIRLKPVASVNDTLAHAMENASPSQTTMSRPPIERIDGLIVSQYARVCPPSAWSCAHSISIC